MPKGYSKRNQSGWRHNKKSIALMVTNKRSCKDEKNPRWKGIKVTYAALHNWIRSHFDKPLFCQKCKQNPGKDTLGRTKLHWANKTKKYLRERKDWICLCSKCHKNFDVKNKIKHRYGKQ